MSQGTEMPFVSKRERSRAAILAVRNTREWPPLAAGTQPLAKHEPAKQR